MLNKPGSTVVVRPKATSEAIQTGFALRTGIDGTSKFENLISSLPRANWESTTHKDLQSLQERLGNLHIQRPPSSFGIDSTVATQSEKTVAEQLFDATSQVKILTSQVAMHLDDEWRRRLFRQLDQIHDVDEWDEGDKPLEKASFATFLKSIFELNPSIRPGLGLSSTGQLIAAWTKDKDRLTLQFQANERVKWIISTYVDGDVEQVAGDTPVRRLREVLVPYSVGKWLGNA